MIKNKEGKVTNGGMITDDAYLYTWDNDTKEGFKMAITADIKEQSKEIRNNPSKVFDMEKKQITTVAHGSCKRVYLILHKT